MSIGAFYGLSLKRKFRWLNRESDASDAENRYRQIEGCLRVENDLLNRYGFYETKTWDD